MEDTADYHPEMKIIYRSIPEDFSSSRSALACVEGKRVTAVAGVLAVEYNDYRGIAQYSITLQDVEVAIQQTSGRIWRVRYQHLHLFVPINDETAFFALNQHQRIALTGRVFRYHRSLHQMRQNAAASAFSLTDLRDLKLVAAQSFA